VKQTRKHRAWKNLTVCALVLGTTSLIAPEVGAQSDAADVEEMKKELRQLKARMQQLKSALEEAEELDRMRTAAIDRALRILEGDAAAMAAKPPELPERPVTSRAAPAPTPRRKPPAPRRDPTGTIRGSVEVPSGEPVAYVFVENVRGPAVRRKVTIEQVQKQFTPPWAVVQRGTTVDFPNLDNIYHNVFSLSPGNSFDLGLYAAGAEAKSHTFREAGGVDVYCNIHPNMASSKHFAKVGADGTFRLEDVPSGRRKVAVWAPGSLLSSEWVELRPGGQAEVNLRLSPKGSGHTRKDGRPYGSYQ